MKSLSNIYMAVAGIVVAMGIMVALNGTSQAVSSYRNCADDAIVRCGAVSESELLQKYDANTGDIQNIYSNYGISRSDLAGEASTIKHGTVYQDGRVVVNGKTVATNAYSVSRVRFTSAGTPREVTINGTTLYEGPSMSIFVRPVDAYVYFRGDEFQSAILSACGNPVMATPVATPQPVKPALKVTKTEQPVTPVEQPQPEVIVTEVVKETPKETPAVLPQTGVAGIVSGSLGVGSLTAVGYYWLSSRRSLFFALLNRK